MTSNAETRQWWSTAIFAVVILFHPMAEAADVGRIEYSQQTHDNQFESWRSLNLLSPVMRIADEKFYSFAEISSFRLYSKSEDDTAFRVGFGFTTNDTLAPYLELSTGFIDLIVLLTEDDDEQVCDRKQGDNCDFDFDVELGVRYLIDSEISLSLFYRRFHFGNFTGELQGNFAIGGIGIGYSF